MKKLLCILFALLMLFSLAGCKTNDENTDNDAQNVAAGAFGKYEPAINLTAVRYLQDGIEFPEGDNIENNVWSRAYADELGINLSYQWTTTQDQYSQKLNVSMASEQLPDLMWVDAAQLKRMVEDDMLADLTDVYADYAADFTSKVLSDDGGSALNAATFNGKLYGLPHIQSGYGSTELLFIRADWLKNIGKEIPSTMAEVIEIAKAFATEDPDKNGANDTYGLAINNGLIANNNLPYAVLDGFFNSYHAYPSIWLQTNNGLEYGGIQSEMKTALAALQDLYKSGAIDPEFGVKDASKVSEDVNAGKIGMFYGYFWNAYWIQASVVNDPTVEWAIVPITSADSNPAKVMVPFATTYYTVVSKDCKNPEAAVKMYNLVLEKMFGETAQPDVYNSTSDGLPVFDYAYSYGEPPLKNMDAQKAVCKALETNDASVLNAEQFGYYNNIVEYLKSDDKNLWGNYMMYGPEGGLAVINDYVDNGKTMSEAYCGAPTDGMAEYNATLDKLALETFTKIIIGTASIDEFDTFVENWNKLGGKQITEEVNQWFNSK